MNPKMNRKGVPNFSPSDTPQMIENCLECPWPECWDCLGKKNDYALAMRVALGGKVNWKNFGKSRKKIGGISA